MHNVVVQGPALDRAERIVIVIHGMSTTIDTLQAGYPAPNDGSLTKIYWRLPILRDGLEARHARGEKDVFLTLFAPVVDESRSELKNLLHGLGERPVGLFGFSIGSLIAFWGAVDNPNVLALATVGGVADLDYLEHYYPDYPWADPAIAARRQSYAVSQHMDRLASIPSLIMHGDADNVAHWEWVKDFAEGLITASPSSRIQKFSHLKHRLQGETSEEQQDLADLRALADRWFVDHLPPR